MQHINIFHIISRLEPVLKIPIISGLLIFLISMPIGVVWSRSIGATMGFSGFYMMMIVLNGSLIFHNEISENIPTLMKITLAAFIVYMLILTNEFYDKGSVVLPLYVYISITISFLIVFYGCFINNQK